MSNPLLILTNCTSAPTGPMVLRICTAGRHDHAPTREQCAACTARVPRVPGEWVTREIDPQARTGFDGSKTWATWYERVRAYAGDASAELAWIDKKLIPGLPCGRCREHAKARRKAVPPDLSSHDGYFDWVAAFQNDVAILIGNWEWSIDRQRERWA